MKEKEELKPEVVEEVKKPVIRNVEFNTHSDMFTPENIKLLLECMVKDILARVVCFKYTLSGSHSVISVYIPTQDLEILMIRDINNRITLRFCRISENSIPYEFSDENMNGFLDVTFKELVRYYWDAYLPAVDTQISSYTRTYNSEWKSEVVDLPNGRIKVPPFAEVRKNKQVFNDLIACYINKEYDSLAVSKFKGFIDNNCTKDAIYNKITAAQKQLYELEKSMGIDVLRRKRIEINNENEKLSKQVENKKKDLDIIKKMISKMEYRKQDLEIEIDALEEKKLRLKLEDINNTPCYIRPVVKKEEPAPKPAKKKSKPKKK